MDLPDFLKSSRARRWHEVAYWGLLLVACVTFYVMNSLTPFKEDDMLHSLVIGDLTHVETVGDLLKSYWNKYFVLNGRSADMLAELFCGLLGKPLFNLCNTLVFGLMVHVISLLATGRQSLLPQVMVYACIGTCYPIPGETLLWLAGSCNYLWTITASLLLLFYLLRHSNRPLPWWKQVLLVIGAFCAGAGNEATSFAFLAAWIVYYLLHRDRVDRVVVLTLVGYGLGALMIMASPAAWERAADGGIVVALPFKELLLSRWHIVSEKMLHYLVPVAAWIVGLVYLLWKGPRDLMSRIWTYLLFFLTLLMLGLGMMLDRCYAPLATISLIIVIIAVHFLTRRLWPLRALAVIAALGLAVLTSSRGIGVLKEYKAFEESIISEVRSAPRQAVLHERLFPTYSRFLYPLKFQSGFYFTNEYIWKAYFDKENIQFVNDSVYNRFHENRLLDGAVSMSPSFRSDHPDLTGMVYGFPDQDYMVVFWNVDSIIPSYQVGMAYWYQSDENLSEQEKEYRSNHAKLTDGNPFGYYPLRFQGQVMFVMPQSANSDSCLVIPIGYDGEEVRIYRTAPNPPQLKEPYNSNLSS